MVGCDRMSTWGSEGGQPDNWIDREIRAGQTRNESSLGPVILKLTWSRTCRTLLVIWDVLDKESYGCHSCFEQATIKNVTGR